MDAIRQDFLRVVGPEHVRVDVEVPAVANKSTVPDTAAAACCLLMVSTIM